MPFGAAVDHRFFSNRDGKDARIAALPRRERRKIKAESRKIAERYTELMQTIQRSGIGYPIDKVLREFIIEYNNRYAASGVLTQPVNFNYFEPFCAVSLMPGTVAPYAMPRPETDHLFSIPDYLDFVTSPDFPKHDLSGLRSLADGQVYHFTQAGSINDFTYTGRDGRPFLISGYSMVRHGSSVFWYLLGGELLSEEDWKSYCEADQELPEESIAPDKRRFLTESFKNVANRSGPPVPLEGTDTAIRTIIAGEIHIVTTKHISRCYLSERANCFLVHCDDPSVLSNIRDKEQRESLFAANIAKIEEAGVMWNLAEAFLHLPFYFQFRLTVDRKLVDASGRPPPRTARGGHGVGAAFKHVKALEVSQDATWVVRPYSAPHLPIETDGYWQRLRPDQVGTDRDGKEMVGKTWVREANLWRAWKGRLGTVYIKSLVSAAKLQLSDYIAAASRAETCTESAASGVLYVMRCLAMKEEVYKVGWTSKTAEERAAELSSATGVPVSFVVVDAWQHSDPAALERGIHARLAPYRLSQSREFFQVRYDDLRAIIEAELDRRSAHQPALGTAAG